MLSLPTSISSLLSAANTKLEEFAEESLQKTEKASARNKARLAIWDDLANDKLHADVDRHLQRKRLDEAPQAAVNAWLEKLEGEG